MKVFFFQYYNPSTGDSSRAELEECESFKQPHKESNALDSDECESLEDIPISFPKDVSHMDVSLHMHNYVGAVSESGKIRNQIQQTELSVVETATQSNPIAMETSTTQTLNCIKNDVSLMVERPTLVYEDVKEDDGKLLFYTGIPNKHIFEGIFDEIKADIDEQTGRKANDTGRPRSLRQIDEFFLVLMRLRLGLLLEDLADRFHIGTSTCSLIFNRWVDYLDVQLSFLVMWPSRENIDITMPPSFKSKYPNCRVIIDCTEIKTETPNSLKLKSVFFSDYKSHMTLKSLIGISPCGVVTFVSDLYAGSASDKQITKLSGLVDLCEVGDAIMVDKGFQISDLTTPKGVQLIIPPFKKKDRQLSKREVEQTRNIANLRIHVERQMERIKNFRILHGVLPITMSPQMTKIWKICVRLTNLHPQLVSKN